ncbi:MAG: thiamine-phosphate synthase family protein [Nanoarchaeota archaeon]|nr:thiamine-phosphate synthase family protein [Nanoarchaeota archaeon]
MLERCWVVPEKSAAVKAALARKLRKQGRTQEEIAEALEITQPSVSAYLKQKGMSSGLIDSLPEGKLHFSTLITTRKVDGQFSLATSEHLLTNEKREILESLTQAAELLKGKDLSKGLPKVKVNLAMAGDDAKGKNDVAAFPSGLLFSKGRLIAYSEPEFGASSHLSQILLYAKARNPEIDAVMNLKFARKGAELDEQYHVKKGRLENFAFHSGGFGIEPALYVFGKDAPDVVKKVLAL